MMNNKELELYVHIPFCARKCEYCDFLSFAAPERIYRDYIEKLLEEIRSQSANFSGYVVTSLFVGGGTPSILPADLAAELFFVLRDNFTFWDKAEVTLEANPGTLTMEKLETYLEGGVNRLSIGLQSCEDTELGELGRIHTYESFLKSYQRARQTGFTNINIDLMSGLPGQDLVSWKNTLKKVLMLKPEHISAYSLIVEEGTPFYERYGTDRSGLPDEETDRAMYHLTKDLMEEHGYLRYEISNYARPGFECRHNNGYWTGTEYLGLGLGASSYTHGFRYHNVNDMSEYMQLDLSQAGAAAMDIEELSQEDRMEEFMFLGLRRTEGVSGSRFLERFGQNMWNVYGDVIKKLEAEGLVTVDHPVVRLTELGIDVSNRVFAAFLLEEKADD